MDRCFYCGIYQIYVGCLNSTRRWYRFFIQTLKQSNKEWLKRSWKNVNESFTLHKENIPTRCMCYVPSLRPRKIKASGYSNPAHYVAKDCPLSHLSLKYFFLYGVYLKTVHCLDEHHINFWTLPQLSFTFPLSQ